jgi:hypothetical protein
LGDKHPSDEKLVCGSFSIAAEASAATQSAKLAYFFIRYLRSACAAITAQPDCAMAMSISDLAF